MFNANWEMCSIRDLHFTKAKVKLHILSNSSLKVHRFNDGLIHVTNLYGEMQGLCLLYKLKKTRIVEDLKVKMC